MNTKNLLDELLFRGFINKVSNFSDLKKNIFNKKIYLYCGFDPTSDSLHIGHLLPLLCLLWFYKYGHKIIIVIGNATSLIGDPSFKIQERDFKIPQEMFLWGQNIKIQIKKFFINNRASYSIILNNYTWFQNVKIIPFLRDIGKFFSINKMINRKSVKNRINRIEQGISFTEFSYNLLQSYDFLYLYKKYKVVLQIGGSDQWGNISSGIHLIKKKFHQEVFGLTIPLLLQDNGMKFGKTEKNNTIWLDSKKTSPYSFYQFWLNIHDDKIFDFLKLFTFLNVKEIDNIQKYYSKKDAKILLADQITEIVHGSQQLNAAKRITHNLFSGKILDLQKSDLYQLQKDGIYSIILNGLEDFKQVLVNANLSVSRSDAHRLISSHAIKINGKKNTDFNYKFSDVDKLFNKFTILSKGKKKHCLLCW
ncbi:tyrosine--tRNA ligase [Buchnera aphidicola]|uniref:tyrosine--tRNA ligase n=1 Tax=Buchnera aphidicola TaxID=9 RepID=UPI003464AB66